MMAFAGLPDEEIRQMDSVPFVHWFVKEWRTPFNK